MKLTQLFSLFLISTITLLGCADNSEKTDVGKAENSAIKENKSAKEIPAVETKTDKPNKAPDFKLQGVDGKEVKLSDYKGKIVVLDFWATWCGPCRRGVPDLVSLQKEYKDKLVVIGISLDRVSGTEADVKKFMQEYKINYPVIFGNEKVTMDYGNIQAIPTSFVIDQKGNIVDKHVGLVPKEAYVSQIKSLL
jgi:cytochrome c biogenesis protein CcmG/thiol:disulfide interchange protein DsbE